MKTDKNWYLIEIIDKDGIKQQIKKYGNPKAIKEFIGTFPKGLTIDTYKLSAPIKLLCRGARNNQEIAA